MNKRRIKPEETMWRERERRSNLRVESEVVKRLNQLGKTKQYDEVLYDKKIGAFFLFLLV